VDRAEAGALAGRAHGRRGGPLRLDHRRDRARGGAPPARWLRCGRRRRGDRASRRSAAHGARRAAAPRPPVRVVFDRNLRLPPESRLVRSAAEVPVWVVWSPGADPARAADLAARGVHLIAAHGLPAALAALREAGIASLFCEGGAALAGTLLAAEIVDRLDLFYAPLLLGPLGARSLRRSAQPSALGGGTLAPAADGGIRAGHADGAGPARGLKEEAGAEVGVPRPRPRSRSARGGENGRPVRDQPSPAEPGRVRAWSDAREGARSC
jgi:hypothetical protein